MLLLALILPHNLLIGTAVVLNLACLLDYVLHQFSLYISSLTVGALFRKVAAFRNGRRRSDQGRLAREKPAAGGRWNKGLLVLSKTKLYSFKLYVLSYLQ